MRRNRWPDLIGMRGRMFRNTHCSRNSRTTARDVTIMTKAPNMFTDFSDLRRRVYFSSSAKSILSRSKAGMSASGLSDALGLTGDVAGRRELNNDLAAWARSGMVYRQRDGRWLWVERDNPLSGIVALNSPDAPLPTGSKSDQARRLFAVPARSLVKDERAGRGGPGFSTSFLPQ